MSDLPLLPLSFDDGDVILRAGDTNFQVHIWLLGLASPFFQSMFSLPQPNLGKSEIPVILIDEEATSLDFILRCIYPTEMPQVTSIDHAQKLFKVADKFDVKRAAELLRAALTPFLAAELNPLRSWAIAVRYGVEEARRAAAKRFRPNTIRHPPKELAYVTALQYFQLLEGYGIY